MMVIWDTHPCSFMTYVSTLATQMMIDQQTQKSTAPCFITLSVPTKRSFPLSTCLSKEEHHDSLPIWHTLLMRLFLLVLWMNKSIETRKESSGGSSKKIMTPSLVSLTHLLLVHKYTNSKCVRNSTSTMIHPLSMAHLVLFVVVVMSCLFCCVGALKMMGSQKSEEFDTFTRYSSWHQVSLVSSLDTWCQMTDALRTWCRLAFVSIFVYPFQLLSVILF